MGAYKDVIWEHIRETNAGKEEIYLPVDYKAKKRLLTSHDVRSP